MNDRSTSRRRVLAGGLAVGAAATAGCLNAVGGRGDAAEVLRLTLSRREGPLREAFVVDLAQTRPTWDEAAFDAAREGAEYTTQYQKPFLSSPDDPTYTRHDGTYYRLGSVVVDEERAVRPVLRLSPVDGAEDSGGDAVAASRLPESDQRAVRIAFLAARARGNDGGAPWGLVQRGGYFYRRESAIETSELLADDGPGRVTFREEPYTVEVSRETLHEPVYRATIEPVARTPERMEAILRAKFVDARFTRNDLSDAARDVVKAARTEGYDESHPYTAGYREVLRTLHKRAYLDGDVRKDAGVGDDERRLLRYDDVYYDYRLRFASPGGTR